MAHEHFKSCIDACNEPDVAKMARCISLDQDCAAICRLATGYMARGSALAADVCELCATICDQCAKECARHPMAHCQDCAKACRRCAEECRRMASDPMRKQSGQRPAASAH